MYSESRCRAPQDGPRQPLHPSAALSTALARGVLASFAFVAVLVAPGLARAQSSSPAAGELPVVVVERDDTVVDSSCRLVFPTEAIADVAGDGVVQIRGDGLRVVCEGGPLRGSPGEIDPDRYRGVGIDVRGTGVTVTGASVQGFKIGLRASSANGLRVIDCAFDDLFRQRLDSTWSAEDPAGWLAPHGNDDGQWKDRYGAAIAVERSNRIRLERVRVRRGQNGILLDRVTDATVTRCDASFLSGWGLALWRSSDNVVRGNRFDYCVRGYSHGRYNRGQDSAGVLLFEQSSRNLFERNSITHGGDGVFGFAGNEALGQPTPKLGFDHRRAGCNDNVFRLNDLSFAAAHGLELTFSFGNLIEQNLFESNAICGVWYGYGRDTSFIANTFIRNGDAGYGAERGAINAEHGQGLVVLGNEFHGDAVGVRLWSDNDAGLVDSPWARINGIGARANAILANAFDGVDPIVELVAAHQTTVSPADPESIAADDVSRQSLTVEGADAGMDATSGAPGLGSPDRGRLEDSLSRAFHGLGPADRLPLERERRRLPDAGRASIVIGEWGPYDWSEPMLQALERSGDRHRYRLLGPSQFTSITVIEGRNDIDVVVDRALPEFPVGPDGLARAVVTIKPKRRGGVTPYRLIVRARGTNLPVEGVLIDTEWDVTWFSSTVDPREDAEAWRAAAEGAPSYRVRGLDLSYSSGGPASVAHPSGLGGAAADALASLGDDGFGTLASTSLELTAGDWLLSTLSDDGVRVRVDGELLIDNWTWHGPTRDEAVLHLDGARSVTIEVEHFELDGYAVLEFGLRPLTNGGEFVEASLPVAPTGSE
ncbi:right-handed parallel beta-helix repeat-containing protein [Engelhardtia mirabilis]|uniref:PA14 domain protein n=1 Tax=Engelhardtia mirabilis TaxID=2528011 RepID=A0A518BP55_9BACT|nr:PA14 domain protein [Planctomycetes bacterium Pla133]QDV03040.1 PA14 domain protein [Planctomycetes bacterium Pla86]